ncbi:MAG: hypothetical protein KA761_00165 [Gemmatimonadaceae bacterium]|nr:hypothetical protein [Gemmatimonadaceae bacterium]
MPEAHEFAYAAIKPLTLGGRTYAPGERVDFGDMPARRIRQMADSRKVVPLYLMADPSVEHRTAQRAAAALAANPPEKRAKAPKAPKAEAAPEGAPPEGGADANPGPVAASGGADGGEAVGGAPAAAAGESGAPDGTGEAPAGGDAPAGGEPPLVATHKGFGRYVVKRGDEVVQDGINKQQALALGATIGG